MTKGENITTKFKVDVSDLKKGIAEATRQITKVRSEFNKTSAEMNDWEKSSKGITAKLSELKSILEQYNLKLKAYQQQLVLAKKAEKEATNEIILLKQALEKAKTEYGENSKQVKDLRKELTEVEKAEIQMKKQVTDLTVTLNNQEATIKKTEREMEKLGFSLDEVIDAEKLAAKSGKTVNEVLDEMHAASDKASEGFTIMKGAIASLVADGIRKMITAGKELVKETINVGKAFDSSMSQVKAITKATTEEFESLKNKAKQLGASTKFSASEVADAFNYMAMAGWKIEDMLNGIDGVLNLAAASGADLATTSDIVTDALTAMGYSTKDASKLADVMASASSNANTNVELMGETFKYVAPVTGALGYSMEDTAIAISLMANSGIKASQAGTSLRSILQRLSTNTSNCQSALKDLGIEFTNADGSMRPLRKVIEDMQKAFSGLNEQEQISLAKTVAGTEAMSGLLAIINAAPSDYEKLTKAIENSNGAAEEMSKIMQDDLNGDLVSVESTIESIQISIYEKLKPSLREGAKNFKDWANSVDWNKFGEKVGKSFDVILQGFKWLLNNSDKVTKTTKLMINAFAIKKINDFGNKMIDLGKDFKKASREIKLTTNVTEKMTLAQKANTMATNAVTIATKGFWSVIKSNPIGAATIAIELLIGSYKLLSNWIKESNKNTNESYLATIELSNKQKELAESIKENSKARKESIREAETEGGAIELLLNRLIKLEQIENKTNTQKTIMKQTISELNELIPNLALKYDEETDSLNQSVEAIKNKIIAQKELIKAQAAQEQLTEIAKEQIKLEKTKAELTENQIKLEDKLSDAKKEFAEAENKWQKTNFKFFKGELFAEMLEAERKVKNLQEAFDENKKSIDENKESLENIKKEYSYFETYAANAFNFSEIGEKLVIFQQKCDEAGKAIPKAIIEGMETGRYAIPESMESLGKLISFDKALSNAELTGKQIPTYISQGVIDGKVSIEQAIDEVKSVIDLSDKIQKMIEEGQTIPQNLAEGILEGAITVEQANKILKDKMEYDDLLAKIDSVGLQIPNDLATNIKEGYITLEQANNHLKSAIDFKDKIKEAEEMGVQIHEELATNISKGYIDVGEATETLNEAIKKVMDGTKQIGIDGGGNLIEGTAEGINNKEKQKKVLSAVGAFGGAVLKAFQNSLDEHSPSKATNKMGKYFLEGFNIGLKQKMKPVLKQVTNFGKGVLNNLNEELQNDTKFTSLTDNIKKATSKVKESVFSLVSGNQSSSTNVQNQTTNNNVINNFTQNINSPKPLSRVEVYRQTRNLLELKAVK